MVRFDFCVGMVIVFAVDLWFVGCDYCCVVCLSLRLLMLGLR